MLILRPIIRFLGFLDWEHPIMNPLDDLFPSPDKDATISHVHEKLRASFSSDHGALVRRLQDCKVNKIELCKGAGGFQHEFLLVTTHYLIDGQSNTARFLVIDRNSNPENLSQTADAGFGSSQFSSNFNSASSQSKLVNSAKDMIKLFSERDDALKSGARSCWTLTFNDGEYVNAINLFSAAVAVHRAAPNYNLVQTMCYWFAHNLLRVLASGRQYEITTTGASANITPGYFYGIPILNSLGKAKDDLPEQLIKDMSTRPEKSLIKNPFKGRLDKSAAYRLDADTTAASFSSEPKRQFIASEVVAHCHRNAQAADQEIVKLISDHAEAYHSKNRPAAETMALNNQVTELTKQVASEREARLASEKEARLASERQTELERQIALEREARLASERQMALEREARSELEKQIEEMRREMGLSKRSKGEGSNV